jgi:protein-S-isoprenylcysteine O-methyltransferase Ste14
MQVNAQRVVAQSTGLFLALTLALFPPAGTLSWLVGWLYLLLFFGFFLGVTAWLYQRNPGLLQERLSLSRVDLKGWDKKLFLLLLVFPVVCSALVSADAVRFHWSPEPIWLQAVGVLLPLCSFYLFFLTFCENSHLSTVVRLQTERGHSVIATRPYRYVRHPMYAGFLLFMIGTPLVWGRGTESSCGWVYDRTGETSDIGGTHIAGRSAGLCRLHGESEKSSRAACLVGVPVTRRAPCFVGRNARDSQQTPRAVPRGGISELVAHANGRVNVGGVEVAAGHAVVHPAVHGAQVDVEVDVEAVIGVERKGVEASAASAVRGC